MVGPKNMRCSWFFMNRFLLFSYFLLLIVSLLIKTRTMQGPWFFLLRAFFPNWKFYHALGWQPLLLLRAREKSTPPDGYTSESYDNANFTENQSTTPSSAHEANVTWSLERLVYPRAKRSVWNLFHNPSVNLALTHQNLVEHLASDLQQLPDASHYAHIPGDDHLTPNTARAPEYSRRYDVHELVSYRLVHRFVQAILLGHLQEKQGLVAGHCQTLEVKSSAIFWQYQFEIRLVLNDPTAKQDPFAGVHTLMMSPILSLDPKSLDIDEVRKIIAPSISALSALAPHSGVSSV